MKCIAVIPARYASSKFAGKPLADIGGKIIIQRVYEQASKAVATVNVATDDKRIFDAVEAFGGKAVMTGTHQSDTSRCYEAYTIIKNEELKYSIHNPSLNTDVVINISGDDPFVKAKQIQTLISCFDDPATNIATLIKAFPYNGFFDDLANRDTIKVLINRRMEAMYFSRAVIPYKKGTDRNQWLAAHTYYKHIGIYAYRPEVLKEITQLPQSPLELAESLEQLRWLENGYKIKTAITDIDTVSIDTPNDLKKAAKLL